MAYVDRIKPEEYNAFVMAFSKVGAPIFVRVAEIINVQRRAAGNPKTIAFTTLKKAWEKGWAEQVGGAPAPAIKTLFPHLGLKAPRHDAPEPVQASPELPPEDSKAPPVRPGAGPVPASDAASQPHGTPHHKEDPQSLDTAMIPHTSAEAVQVLDPLKAAIMKLDEGRATALLNEMGILAAARQNIRGLQDIANVVIATLAGRQDILRRLVMDLESNDAVSLRTVRDTLKELGAVLKDLAATNKAIQESQRLLVGMPQRIEERRTPGSNESEIEARTVARMASMLRTKLSDAHGYDGEETGDGTNDDAQDAEFVDENTAPPGKEKANTNDDAT